MKFIAHGPLGHQGNALKHELTEAFTAAALKATPPVTVTAAVVSGATLNTVVVLLTAIYLVAQIGYLVWKWRREAKRKE